MPEIAKWVIFMPFPYLRRDLTDFVYPIQGFAS